MQAKVKFVKKYDKKWGLGLENLDGLQYTFEDCSHIQQGDVIDFELVQSGKYTNLHLTGKVPSTDVNSDIKDSGKTAPDDRQVDINSQSMRRDAVFLVRGEMNALKSTEPCTLKNLFKKCDMLALTQEYAKSLIKGENPAPPKEETTKEPF